MQTDEAEIRQVIATWMAATKAGDVDKVLSLMADDVVFLVAGQPVMRKDDFAKAARAQSQPGGPRIDGHSEIQEIKIAGEWAFAWSELAISVTLPDGKVVKRAGHTLSVFKKEHGKWVLARDANLLTTQN